MNESQQGLYERISQFSFDEGEVALSFARRLARENGWAADYTRRAIEEYRRFIFLAVVAGHPVTPSDQVDQVWHLHLTYTRSYWDRFCGEVLGTPVHHGPTRGGHEESQKFRLWYQNTLESYRRLFGDEPPKDVWPEVAIRFGESRHFERIDTERHWVIPKPRLRSTARKIALALLFVGVFLTFVLGIGAQGVGGDSSLETPSNGSQSSSTNADDLWRIVSVGAIGAIFIFVFIFQIDILEACKPKCPQCKQRLAQRVWALEKTGVVSVKETDDGIEREEWKCKYCGFRRWKDKPSGGGDGGCGGA